MIKVYFDGETKHGAYVKDACVEVSEDYTMVEIVRAIKDAGYKTFMFGEMRSLARVPEGI